MILRPIITFMLHSMVYSQLTTGLQSTGRPAGQGVGGRRCGRGILVESLPSPIVGNFRIQDFF